MITHNQEKIKEHIIHRYENLLLDSVDVDPENSNNNDLSITISDGDSLGRDIFLKQKTTTQKVLLPTLFMEILALSCILVSGKLKEGEMVIFAAISNFKKTSDFPEATKISGHVEKISDKKGFLKYKGSLSNGNTPICTGDMMAYFTTVDAEGEVQKKVDIPQSTCTIPIEKSDELKNPLMIVGDSLIEYSDTTFCTTYTYPEDHPFIKGHFPNNPLMMGVMQWMSIEDGLLTYCKTRHITGKHTISGDAQIIKSDGTLVAEIKAFVTETHIDIPNLVNQVEMIETKKIAFRSMVRPGETIFIECTNLIIQ